MTRLETRLASLCALLVPPWTAGWVAYVWREAQTHAQQEPEEFADLPQMLRAASPEVDAWAKTLDERRTTRRSSKAPGGRG